MFKWLMSNENVKDFWNYISRNEKEVSKRDQEEFDVAMYGLHLIVGALAAIVSGVTTFLGFYVLLLIGVALLLGIIWGNFEIHGKMAAGYFIAMSVFSLAWMVYLPILLIVLLFSSPIIISSYREFKKNESSR